MHAARQYASMSVKEKVDSVLVKIDVRNAFNSVRRDVMLRELKRRCPEIYHLDFQSYFVSTPLPICGHQIASATGV